MIKAAGTVKIFFAGDVMTGRGIDQVLSTPNTPEIYESYLKDARDYVSLAEKKNGHIPRPVSDAYIWGDALEEWDNQKPLLRIVNLETSITKKQSDWKNKGINYRMHPENIGVLTSAKINVVSLANNHILDYGRQGLDETLQTLQRAGIQYSGAGRNAPEALAPSISLLGNGKRLLLFSLGTLSSGIPDDWKALNKRPGVYFLEELNSSALIQVKKLVECHRKDGDIVAISLHWGGNWGYQLSEDHRLFARQLVDSVGIQFLFGHSSHHPRAIEIYKGIPLLYGVGDFINDYEGISGREEYRGDLVLMYFVEFDRESSMPKRLIMTPMQIRKFRLHYASPQDVEWLMNTLNRVSLKCTTVLEVPGRKRLVLNL